MSHLLHDLAGCPAHCPGHWQLPVSSPEPYRALCNVLVEILDSLDRTANFYIDMCVEFCAQLHVMGHDPSVIDQMVLIGSIFYKLKLFSLPTSIDWVSAFRVSCFRRIRLQKVLRARAFMHASTLWIRISARPVSEVFANTLVGSWELVLIWQFGYIYVIDRLTNCWLECAYILA